SLADILRWRADSNGDHTALTYLADGVNEAAKLSFGTLDRMARGVAAMLQQNNTRGESVILLFEPGPEFLVGFLACIYAGARGVPLYPPDVKRLARTLPRFLAIVEDCRAGVILTTTKMKAMGTAVFEFAPQLATRKWLAVDDVPPALYKEWSDPGVSLDELAFLQYTSGSTGDPKGVEVTHRALLLNFTLLGVAFSAVPGENTVTWLPNYHDMGLIDGWMRPIFNGSHSAAMPPMAFLKNPASWLKAISKYRAGVSGGPNFAYELCIAKVPEADIAELDLSCWHTAYCGAEPVRAETVRRFSERFARCGLRPQAFSAGYGLAEATLVVGCNSCSEMPVFYPVRKADLEKNRVVEAAPGDKDVQVAVGVGKPVVDTTIVDPETRLRCPVGKVGEIWLSGPSLARGYMNRPEINREMFGATLSDTGEGPYLRTGDMGFMRADGELFIGGRRKDLVIIAGKNHYPQDIEKTVEESDRKNLRPGCTAAFSIEMDNAEKLVIVQELQPGAKDPDIASIRAAVTEDHGVDPYSIVLSKTGTIPKTSSGKIQRKATKESYVKGELDVVASWKAGAQPAREEKAGTAAAGAAEKPARASGARDSEKGARIRAWLRKALSERLSIPVDKIEEDRPFAQLGLDSREGIILVGDMEKWLGTELAVSIIYDHPSINRLVRYLDGMAADVPSVGVQVSGPVDEPIAVVGIGCRFPGAESPGAYWRLLREGKDAVSEIPPDRWNRDAFYDPDPAAPGKMVSKYGGFLRQVDQFDPQAFDMTVREAARTDPQQRLLLEVAAEALENAGVTPMAAGGSRTGVFVGISSFDYGRQLFADHAGIDAYCGTGAALSIAANRISYQFDLHGPSMAIDTACSSSLVAVHAAVQSLRSGESEMALCGGVNAIMLPDVNITFTKAGVLSPNGHCRTFDAKADGITRGEGAGVIVLKRLSKAVADGDHIWAVIKGSAVNSDGRSNGLMAPNGSAQQEAIAQAYRAAGVDPAKVQYVEAHGTGTILGDPIEARALSAVVSAHRPADNPCRIGSVKANFGHLEACAGIAGIIKVAMALHNRELVPSIQYSEPNPGIPFGKLKLAVQTVSEPWPS
ncbi:MAG: beta-ketoacyl synthase N-terminal-like domain-containing protein, partial [Myxococcota bacterium]